MVYSPPCERWRIWRPQVCQEQSVLVHLRVVIVQVHRPVSRVAQVALDLLKRGCGHRTGVVTNTSPHDRCRGCREFGEFLLQRGCGCTLLGFMPTCPPPSWGVHRLRGRLVRELKAASGAGCVQDCVQSLFPAERRVESGLEVHEIAYVVLPGKPGFTNVLCELSLPRGRVCRGFNRTYQCVPPDVELQERGGVRHHPCLPVG
jgi:hypothetical protein